MLVHRQYFVPAWLPLDATYAFGMLSERLFNRFFLNVEENDASVCRPDNYILAIVRYARGAQPTWTQVVFVFKGCYNLHLTDIYFANCAILTACQDVAVSI